MDWHIIEEDTEMANKPMKRCSISFAIREVQIKTTMGYHYIPIRMTKRKTNDNAECWRRCRETGQPTDCSWE